MKTYYVECEVSFIDNSEEKQWKSSEIYSFIITAKNEKEGKVDAINKAKEELINQNRKMDDVNVIIHQFYVTDSCARAN